MSYARARLYLGASCVGMWVVLAGVALAFGLPARVFSTSPRWGEGEVALLGVVFLYAALSGAFDLFGGYLLPREYGRFAPPLPQFLWHWLRGASLHGLILLGVALTLLSAGRLGGFWLALGAYLLLSAALLGGQLRLARLLGGLRVVGERDGVLVLASPYPHLTGGVVGLPGWARIVVPAAWQARSEAALGALVARRRALVANRSRLAGLALALAWNLVGFVVAYLGAGTVAHVAGVVSFSLWSTLWAFLGVLLLPTPSRRGVFAGDVLALQRGVPPTLLADTILRLERDQDDEISRTRGVETVFHPIPAAARRLDALAEPRASWGPWHAARTALYLSWANLSWLSRAVHCNLGRPEVWVLLPSD
jgi:hypothetical protein